MLAQREGAGNTRTRAAGTFTRRIGYTTYRVNVHFGRASRETAQDKIKRLIRMETQNGKATG